ncbi:DUF3168 domain-containing protein [Sphingomonas montanisoli]|uniref:DUF3168 domain-containing protein n=1 Tax=Sphingomonas montanisoli TaxID=2606412 RepID=A0A5D9C932_9SPHN|nr:DUF3168 domain-containing protein [Sphingomonas montanisoli]TZG26505.1 DUF3168 domain-containing protein [Sphingomonas montanisoli]
MSVTAALRDRANDHEPLATILAGRAWRDEARMQRPAKPYLIITLASDPREYTHDGEVSLRGTLIQFDVYSASRGDADAIGPMIEEIATTPAIVGAVAIQRGFVEFAGDSKERADGEIIYRTRRDIRVWWQPQPEEA